MRAEADTVPAASSSSVALDSVRKVIPMPSFSGRWEQVNVKYTTIQSLEGSLGQKLPQLTTPYLGAPSLDFWSLVSLPRGGFISPVHSFNPSGWALPADGLPLELREYLRVPVPTVLLEGTNGTASGQQFGLRAGLPLSRRTDLAGHFVRTNAKGPYERQSVLSDDFLVRVVRRDSVGSGSWLAAVQRLSWKGFENGGVMDPSEVVGVGYGFRNRALVDTRWGLASSNRVSTQALVQRRWKNGSLGYRWEQNRRAFKPDALGLDTAWGGQHRLEYVGWERLTLAIQATQFRPDTAALSTAGWQRWTPSVGWRNVRTRSSWMLSGRLAWDSRWGWMPQAEVFYNQKVRPDRSTAQTGEAVELAAAVVSVSSFRLRAQRMEVPWLWQSDWVGAAPWQAEAHWLPLAPWVRRDRVAAWTITARGWHGLRVPTSSGYLGIRSFTEPTAAWTVQSTVDLSTGFGKDAASSRWRSSLRMTGALSSNAYALPLPLFAYVGTVARNWNLEDRGVRLEAELGAVGNSPYYAPAYDPRWGAEVTQVGWLPAERQRIQQWVLPFLQLQVRWKTASAFVVLNQFNQGWGPWAAFAAPYMPVANAHLRLGARWYLFN